MENIFNSIVNSSAIRLNVSINHFTVFAGISQVQILDLKNTVKVESTVDLIKICLSNLIIWISKQLIFINIKYFNI